MELIIIPKFRNNLETHAIFWLVCSYIIERHPFSGCCRCCRSVVDVGRGASNNLWYSVWKLSTSTSFLNFEDPQWLSAFSRKRWQTSATAHKSVISNCLKISCRQSSFKSRTAVLLSAVQNVSILFGKNNFRESRSKSILITKFYSIIKSYFFSHCRRITKYSSGKLLAVIHFYNFTLNNFLDKGMAVIKTEKTQKQRVETK